MLIIYSQHIKWCLVLSLCLCTLSCFDTLSAFSAAGRRQLRVQRSRVANGCWHVLGRAQRHPAGELDR